MPENAGLEGSASAITYVGPWRTPVILASASNTPAMGWTAPSLSVMDLHMLMRPPHSPMTILPFPASALRPSRKSVLAESISAWSSGYPPPR